jgi:aromatic-L-amino-acid decarboxylase
MHPLTYFWDDLYPIPASIQAFYTNEGGCQGGKKGVKSIKMGVQGGKMSERNSYHMTPDEFRQYGRAVIDWIADYYQTIESFPVLSPVKPGQIRLGLPPHPPLQGEVFEDILADVSQVIMPGITHWQSPNFFAYFPANTSGPAILGDLLSSGLGVQGMLWVTSPACTELETHVMDWMAEMLALPAKFGSGSSGGGVIQDSASSATLCALLAARERATGLVSNEVGCDGRLVAYTSTQAHSSVEKAVKIAGLGWQNLRFIDVDENYAMRPARLREQIQQDRHAGLLPCFVTATLGTTSSNAFDPLPEIGAICREESVWLHVDGAMAGSAAICPEFRGLQAGLELADSYCTNPHKWMFTNFDCDCFYVARRADLILALSVLPEYLRNQATESGAVIDYRDWQVPLGRRFRALKLWFVIRHYGVEGLQYHIRRHVALAQEFARWVAASPDFELAAPAPLNLVCLRHRLGDDFNRRLLERLNSSGFLYLTHTVLDGKFTLRLCVGQTHTEERHVKQAWNYLQDYAVELQNEGGHAS